MEAHPQDKPIAKQALFQRLLKSGTRNKSQSGFTLIELLIVVLILGILSAIGVPSLINQQKKAVASANNTMAMSAARACAAAIAGGTPADYEPVADVTAAPGCATGATFTANKDATKASSAVATISALGGVTLTTVSAAI